jgi:hypothetical protein
MRRSWILVTMFTLFSVGSAVYIVQHGRPKGNPKRPVTVRADNGRVLQDLFEGLRPHPVWKLEDVRSDMASRAKHSAVCLPESLGFFRAMFLSQVFAQTACQSGGCAGQNWIYATKDCEGACSNKNYEYATHMPPGNRNGGYFVRTTDKCTPCQNSQCEHVYCDMCFGAPPCNDDTDCTGNNFCSGGCCQELSPIVIDIDGNGFSLTSAYGGIEFDFAGDGVRRKISWTAAGSDDGWLALDRNGNGRIDSSLELFGNLTAQVDKPGVERNGFEALAAFDQPLTGGNGDGTIDEADRVFVKLLIWQDINHNGESERGELKALRSVGIKSIALRYRESKRVDEHGNEFRYAARVQRSFPSTRGDDWAYDVFLLREQSQSRRR